MPKMFTVNGKIVTMGGKIIVGEDCCCIYEVLITGGHSFGNGGGFSQHPYCEEYIRDWRPRDPNNSVTQNDSQLHTDANGNPVIPAWLGANSRSSMEVILRHKATGIVAFSAHTSDNGNPGVLPTITWTYPGQFDGICHNLPADGWNGCAQARCGNPLP